MLKPLFVACSFGASSLIAESPCSVDWNGHDEEEIDVNYSSYSYNDIPAITYHDHQIKVSVIFGGPYEAQKVLIMSVDDSNTTIYDPKVHSLYQHSLNDGTRVQCHFNRI